MKNIGLFLLSLILLYSPDLIANEIGWVKGLIWDAPVILTANLKVDTSNIDLKSTCDSFEILNSRYAEMPLQYRKQMFEAERSRATAQQFPSTSYSVEIKIEIPANGSILANTDRDILKALSSSQGETDDRVQYTQMPADEVLDTKSLSLKNVKSAPGALTGLAQAFGSSVSPVTFSTSLGELRATIYGKDLACDLVRGRAILLVNSRASAILNQTQILSLRALMGEISSISNDVLSRFARPKQRAALLGFRLGGLYANIPDISQSRAESAMLNALATYFTPSKLDFNSLWQPKGFSPNTGRKLSISGISNPFEVILTIGAGR
jgi:hypothetical protein